jgi:UDP-N-acetylglucosamine acyltransferase
MNQSMVNVHPDAKIGENVVIEPFATIYGDVEVGDGSWIGPNAVLMDGTRLGKNCKVFPGAVISGVPQDLKYDGEYTTVEVGDNTVIRECVTINKGTKTKNKTVVGNNCLIMSYVHIAHDCFIRNGCILGGYTGLAGEVEIDDFAITGGGALVHQFVRIGKHAFVQGASKVSKDVPPFIIAGREPISYAGPNSVGLRRRGFSIEDINEIQEIYRIIYQKGMNNRDAVTFAEENAVPSQIRDTILDFVRSSKRGIIKGLLDY